MKKAMKIITTLFLILSIVGTSLFFLIYPNYNKILLFTKSLNTYNISKDTSIKIFTSISPSQENYQEKVLSATSIEQSLKAEDLTLERKLLEETNTHILIEEIAIDGPILQGITSKTMDDGFWHFPISPFPGEKGNVVVIGHRFMHLPPNENTFFNLDKIKIGQKIRIKSTEDEYTYIVVEKKEVEPNDISVIQESQDYRLTLITCTPLWTSEKRLVIVAKLDKLYKKV